MWAVTLETNYGKLVLYVCKSGPQIAVFTHIKGWSFYFK